MADASRRCAVVFNPTKVSDTFTETFSERAREAGWADVRFLETSEDDPGHSMTREALDGGADLVVAAGGDGTVRVVAGELSGSGTTLGLIPAGTGNLLARNLGIPLKEDEAIAVLVAGHTRTIDLIEVTADDATPQASAVMAGMGVDAMIMDETNPDLKDKIGSAAYFVAAAKAVGRLPMDVTIRVDEHRPHHRRAMICAVGNVGMLTGNIMLIPGAEPDDGQLDVYVASPHRVTEWLRVLIRLITRSRYGGDRVDQWRGRRVEIRLRQGTDTFELDGDVAGECRRLVAEVQPGALTVCVPQQD